MQESLPLSRSPLWQLQREYFDRRGPEAWRQDEVPSFITTNAFIAHGYAQVVAAYLADEPDDEIPSVLELGAGSGRFAHHFLRSYFDGSPRPPIRYVLSDASEANLEFWRSHPQFAPFVTDGRLDFARFDVCSDRAPHGVSLSGRLVAIANYVFDGIPLDVFETDGGQLYEHEVTLEELSLASPLRYRRVPCARPRYAEPSWDELLEGRAGVFSLPVGALRCVQTLRALSGGRLLLISADKGSPASRASDQPPEPARHGSVSFSVNYHALDAFVRRGGGQVLALARTQPELHVAAYVFGARGELSQTREAFALALDELTPHELVQLRRTVLRHGDTLGLVEIAELLELARCDAQMFLACQARLHQLLPRANPEQRALFRGMLREVLAQELEGTRSRDLYFPMGTLMSILGEEAQAIALLERSASQCGPTPETSHNLAVCYASLGRLDEARRHAREALAQRPDLKVARLLGHDLELSLLPLAPAHAPFVAAHADAETLRLARLPSLASEQQALRWIHEVTGGEDRHAFGIQHTERGMIGVITLATWDRAGRFVIWLASEHRDQGLGTAAVHRLCHVAVRRYGLNELFTAVLSENARSLHVLQSLGFQVLEGESLLFLRWGPSVPDSLSRVRLQQLISTATQEGQAWPA